MKEFMSANTLKFILFGLFALIGLIFLGIFAFIATAKTREDAKKWKEYKTEAKPDMQKNLIKDEVIKESMDQLSKGA